MLESSFYMPIYKTILRGKLRKQATDYFEFTDNICNQYAREQKLQLIESLWKVALIDNNLDVEEAR